MALPADFIQRTRTLLGNTYELFEAALQSEAPVSLRLNSNKAVSAPSSEPVAWCKKGYYLPERLSFTFDPLFHAGVYYVQEAASMFLEQAIRTHIGEPVKCLDLCAAPGGKSTHLLDVLPEGSLVVSNEVIRNRSHILTENMLKWGNPNHIVTNNDPEAIGRFTHLFDVIVTDVPCSGEGMFRKDTDSANEWSIDNVMLCAARQRRIIHDIWEALKPGGLLIYSTCTYNIEENEENIHYIVRELGAEVLSIPTQKEWQITGALKYDHPVYRFFPHRTKGEGFFLTVLRKHEGRVETIRLKKEKKEQRKQILPFPKEVFGLLSNNEDFLFEWDRQLLRALPEPVRQVLPLLSQRLQILSAGIEIGEQKGRDLIPSQALALTTALSPNAFQTIEADWDTAIRYLKKEAISLPETTPKGYVLIRYKGFPIGFVKHLGNRSNNLYPQEWRIRTSYIPEQIKLL